jgi:hypothetical protein
MNALVPDPPRNRAGAAIDLGINRKTGEVVAYTEAGVAWMKNHHEELTAQLPDSDVERLVHAMAIWQMARYSTPGLICRFTDS